jgi:hypothetical protein
MTVTNYTDLQSEVAANSNRSDLTARIPTFIQMAETEMQRELKMSEFEATATIAVTAGFGTLPTGFVGARSMYWDGDLRQPMTYVTPDRYNALVASNFAGTPLFYTVQGGQLKTVTAGDGNVVMQGQFKFTPLSGSNLTNAIIDNYPDAYFFGTLMFLYHHMRNWVAKGEQRAEFMRVMDSIKRDQQARKYPGPLEVKPR